MRNGLKFMGLAAAAALSLTALALSEGVVLKRTAKSGDTAKYKLTADLEMGGQPLTLSAGLSDKVVKVSDSGDVTVESTMKDGKISINGADQDLPSQTTTSTYKNSGELVSVKSETDDPNGYRFEHMLNIEFPSKPLNVGDSWTVQIKKDDKGSVDATGTYKVEARETIGSHDTYRIHVSYKEAISQDPASAEGTVWIDVKDGWPVNAKETWTNAPIGPTPMNAKMTMTRVD